MRNRHGYGDALAVRVTARPFLFSVLILHLLEVVPTITSPANGSCLRYRPPEHLDDAREALGAVALGDPSVHKDLDGEHHVGIDAS
jgi:hypothetical protein